MERTLRDLGVTGGSFSFLVGGWSASFTLRVGADDVMVTGQAGTLLGAMRIAEEEAIKAWEAYYGPFKREPA